MTQRIRLQTLNHEVPSSNLLTVVVVSLDKALYPQSSLLIPQSHLLYGGRTVGRRTPKSSDSCGLP